MIHTRTQTDLGPDYCQECSASSGDWVIWPCEPSTWGFAVPVDAMRENYSIHVYQREGYETVVVNAGTPSVERVVPNLGESYAFDRVVWPRRVTVTVSPTGRSVRVWIDGVEVLQP